MILRPVGQLIIPTARTDRPNRSRPVSAAFQSIILEVSEAVATITLNRPGMARGAMARGASLDYSGDGQESEPGPFSPL
jgi:hypothetical protein